MKAKMTGVELDSTKIVTTHTIAIPNELFLACFEECNVVLFTAADIDKFFGCQVTRNPYPKDPNSTYFVALSPIVIEGGKQDKMVVKFNFTCQLKNK